jgi:hypothetical protein
MKNLNGATRYSYTYRNHLVELFAGLFGVEGTISIEHSGEHVDSGFAGYSMSEAKQRVNDRIDLDIINFG